MIKRRVDEIEENDENQRNNNIEMFNIPEIRRVTPMEQ